MKIVLNRNLQLNTESDQELKDKLLKQANLLITIIYVKELI